MKKLVILAATIAIYSSAFADEMRTVLIQGTKTICANDKKPVAENSNLQVSIPESSIDGISWYSTGDVELNRNVNVKIGSRACTLPKGAVLEKVVIQISCAGDSAIKYFVSGPDDWYSEKLSDNNMERCGGQKVMFKRVAKSDIKFENDKYLMKDLKPIYMSDTQAQYNGVIDEQIGRVNFFVSSSETKYKIPYVTGAYVPVGATSQK